MACAVSVLASAIASSSIAHPRGSLLDRLADATLSPALDAAVRAVADRPPVVATGGAWVVDGDAVVQRAYAAGGQEPYRLVLAPPRLAGGVSATVELASSGRGLASAGVLAWMTGPDEGAGVALDEGAGVRWIALQDGRVTTRVTAAHPIARGRPYRLQVRNTTAGAQVLVDDVVVLETAEHVPDGARDAGLFVERGEGVRFRAVTVTSAAGGDLAVAISPPALPASIAPLLVDRTGLTLPRTRTRDGLLVRTVALRGDHRTSLVVPPATTITVPVRVDGDMLLRTEIGVVPPMQPPSGSARLTITAEAGDRVLLLVDEVLDGAAARAGWHARTAPLSSARLGNADARLVVRSEPLGPGDAPLVALANPVVEPAARASRDRPDVVLIVVDTLRADQLGLYGASQPTSPFLDDLARRSVVFDDAVAQSSWTKTSMASLLTSTLPETNGIRGSEDVMRTTTTTLAAALRNAGYFTAQVQSNPWIHPRFRLTEGFMEYRGLDGWPAADRVSDTALEVLRRRPAGPTFLYVHYMDVHHPYAPPPAYRSFGDGDAAAYRGEIRYIDDQLRRLFDAFSALGLLEHAVIVVCSDHGEEFGEHGGRFHGGTLFDEVVRVPLLLHGPTVGPPGRVSGRVRLLDVAPTLLALAGVTIPTSFEGVPLPAPGDQSPRRTAVSQVGLNDVAPGNDLLAITSGPWRYIVDRRTDRRVLFHRRDDPEERTDLATRRPDVVARLDRAATRLLARAPNGTGASGRAPIDAETREHLRALGYLR